MKKVRKKDKGFTLIELLVTIAILTLVVSIAVVVVLNIMDSSEEKKNEIDITTVRKAANLYTEEFKLDEKYWSVDSSDSETEYSCTTIGMLINKGFLKEKIIGTKVNINEEEKTINRDTSIKIDRNKSTKVYTGEVLFNTAVCSEVADISVNFEVNGTKNDGYDNWYNNDVSIRVNATNTGLISDVDYTVQVGNDTERVINPVVNGEKTNNWNISIGEQGREIDVCLTITDRKDKTLKFCLSDANLEYNMDKEKPSTPTLVLNKNGDYELVSSGSRDNITSESELVYHFSENDDTSKGDAKYTIPVSTRYETGKNINTFTVDEAGNKSDSATKNLVIKNSQTVSSSSKYFCSLDGSGIYYDTQAQATSSCTNRITNHSVTPKTVYTCSLNSNEYTTQSNASSNCYDTKTGTISSSYYCSSGGTRSGTTCTHTTTQNGQKSFYLQCSPTANAWQAYDYSSTSYGCPSGYSKTSFTCGTCTKCGTSCSSHGSTTSQTVSCTNYCSKTYSATRECYCALTGSSSCTASCSKTTYGTVGTKTKYTCSYNNQTYTNESQARSACAVSTSGTTSSTHYCNLTNKTYSTASEATNACTNYCAPDVNNTSRNPYYNGACYYLNN